MWPPCCDYTTTITKNTCASLHIKCCFHNGTHGPSGVHGNSLNSGAHTYAGARSSPIGYALPGGKAHTATSALLPDFTSAGDRQVHCTVPAHAPRSPAVLLGTRHAPTLWLSSTRPSADMSRCASEDDSAADGGAHSSPGDGTVLLLRAVDVEGVDESGLQCKRVPVGDCLDPTEESAAVIAIRAHARLSAAGGGDDDHPIVGHREVFHGQRLPTSSIV